MRLSDARCVNVMLAFTWLPAFCNSPADVLCQGFTTVASGNRMGQVDGWPFSLSSPPPLCPHWVFSLTGSHGANCAWQVCQCITAHSTGSGSHPSHPVSTPLLHASLICLPAWLTLWTFCLWPDLRFWRAQSQCLRWVTPPNSCYHLILMLFLACLEKQVLGIAVQKLEK